MAAVDYLWVLSSLSSPAVCLMPHLESQVSPCFVYKNIVCWLEQWWGDLKAYLHKRMNVLKLCQWWKPGIGSAVRCDNWRLFWIHFSESNLQWNIVVKVYLSTLKFCSLVSLQSTQPSDSVTWLPLSVRFGQVTEPVIHTNILSLWWNLNWKSWNYRQIVQWWLSVFWTLNCIIAQYSWVMKTSQTNFLFLSFDLQSLEKW